MTTSTITVKPVDSSLISDAGYDPATGTLCIFFKQKGGRSKPYHYPCTPEQHAEFEAADSKGSHFERNIRKNSTMPHTKIEETDEERADRKRAEQTSPAHPSHVDRHMVP